MAFGPRSALQALLISFAAIAAFLPSLFGEFVYDDTLFVERNPYIREMRPLEVWTEPFPNRAPGVGLYRPLTVLAYAIQYAGWGLDPRGYHATSLVLHAAASLLLWRILIKLWTPPGAFWCALLFAVHPVHVQAVAWISAQSELWSAALGLASLLFLLNGRVGASLVAFAGALAAKESAVAIPIYTGAIAWFVPSRVLRRRWGLWFAGVAAVGAAWFILRWHVLGGVGPSGVAQALTHAASDDRWHLTLQALGRAVVSVLFPADLALDPVLSEGNLGGPSVLRIGAACLLLAYAALGLRRMVRVPTEAAGLRPGLAALAFLAGWLPVSNWIVPIGELYADRFLYLNAAVGCGLLASTLARNGVPSIGASRAAAVAVGALIVLWGGMSWGYASDWTSPGRLFAREVAASPRGNRAQLGLAVARAEEAPRQVEPRIARSLRSRPTPNALANQAGWRIETGDPDGARRALSRLETLAPGFAHRGFLEADLARRAGDPRSEREALERVLALQPDHIPAGLRMAELLREQGDPAAAEERLDRVPELWIDGLSPAAIRARWSLGERPDVAEMIYAGIRRRGASGWRLFREWGTACALQGKFREAEDKYREALERARRQGVPAGEEGRLHAFLAAALARQLPPRVEEARRHAERARGMGQAIPSDLDRLFQEDGRGR